MPSLEQWQLAAIRGYLESCSVGENKFISSGDEAATRALFEKIRGKAPIGDLMSDFDVLDVVLRRSNLLGAALPSEYSGALVEAPNAKQLLAEIESNLAKYFESFPRQYFVYFPLQNMPPLGDGELLLTEALSIIDTSALEYSLSNFVSPNNQLVAALMGYPQPSLEKNTRYVRIRVEGFANASLNSVVASSAFAQVKHYVFTSMAKGVLRESPRFGRKPPTLPVVIRHEIGDPVEDVAIQLPEEFGRFLARLGPNFDELRYYDTSNGKGLLSGTNRLPETPEELGAAIRSQYGRSAEFLAMPRESPDIERIKAAIEWWIDGVSSDNQTISFLQFCLGFEALLGDPGEGGGRPSERGITERLSDRYAYIRGRTQSERQAYRDEFRKVYKRRSDIVHQRETRLRRPEDAEACNKAKNMLYMAIASELNGVLKAKN